MEDEHDEACYCSKCGRGVHMNDICSELEDYFCETCCECCCCKHLVRGPQYKGLQYTNH